MSFAPSPSKAILNFTVQCKWFVMSLSTSVVHDSVLWLLPVQRQDVKWMRRLFAGGKGYEAIPPDDPRFQINQGGNLTVTSLTDQDVGLYTCFKNNAEESVYVLGVDVAEGYKQIATRCNYLSPNT